MTENQKLKKRADFCKKSCPICVRARSKGKGVLFTLVRLESRLCPFCRAYTKVYGKPAYEK